MTEQKCELSVGGFIDSSRTKHFEEEPIQRRFDLLMYYILAGQTSLLQVQEASFLTIGHEILNHVTILEHRKQKAGPIPLSCYFLYEKCFFLSFSLMKSAGINNRISQRKASVFSPRMVQAALCIQFARTKPHI